MITLRNLGVAAVAAFTFLSVAIPPAEAVGGKMHLEDISLSVIESLDEATQVIEDLKAPDGEPAMLLPAIQKVRDAAQRAGSKCASRQGLETECVVETLAELIIKSEKSREKPTLLELFADGTGQTPRKAILWVRKTGKTDLDSHHAEEMLGGILIGLSQALREAEAPGEALNHVNNAVELVQRWSADDSGAE